VMHRQQMIPANTKRSLQHRDGARLQRQHGAQAMVLMTVKQWLLQIPSYPMQVLEVLLMQFLPAANILKKRWNFYSL